jgi:hypothetical protein
MSRVNAESKKKKKEKNLRKRWLDVKRNGKLIFEHRNQESCQILIKDEVRGDRDDI